MAGGMGCIYLFNGFLFKLLLWDFLLCIYLLKEGYNIIVCANVASLHWHGVIDVVNIRVSESPNHIEVVLLLSHQLTREREVSMI